MISPNLGMLIHAVKITMEIPRICFSYFNSELEVGLILNFDCIPRLVAKFIMDLFLFNLLKRYNERNIAPKT